MDQELDGARARAEAGAGALDRARALDLDNPNVYSPILETVCDLLGLQQRPHWIEALRIGVLPHVPGRITLTNPAIWRRTLKAYRSGLATQSDHEHAASQLLLDNWLFMVSYHNDKKSSPFRELAELTREIDAPLLRIAHCLRDLVYGNENRTQDLVVMVQSDDPAYVRIFEDAFWRDPATKAESTI